MTWLPEWVRKFHAHVFGYFWKPCPKCGRMFSGRERGGGAIWTTGGPNWRHGLGKCSRCPGGEYAPDYSGYKTSTD